MKLSKLYKNIHKELSNASWKENKQVVFLILLLAFSSVYEFISPQKAHATAASGFLLLDRMAQSQNTGGSVCFNPVTNETTVRKIDISFPVSGTPGTADATHFGVNQTAANWTWDTTNIPATIANGTNTAAFPGTATTSTVSSGVVTFIVTADQSLNTGTFYCLHFTGTSTLSTPTSSGSTFTGTSNLRNTGGTILTNETVNYDTAIVGANADQIAVTGSVSSTFSFSLGSNTAALGTIPTAANGVSATGVTATVSTNAQNGWVSYVKSTNGNLTSSSTGDTISAGAYQTGSGNIVDLASATGYVLDVDTGTNTPTIATEFDGNTTAKGGKLPTAYKLIAYQTAPASASTVTLLVRARATATNKAASDYADTLTVSAAGQF